MQKIIATLVVLLVASSAIAADTVCPELNALQRWAGYVSWMGFFKAVGYVTLAVGVYMVFGGVIRWAWKNFWFMIRQFADVLGYVVSIGLILGGAWTPALYQIWPVFIGCVLFGGSLILSVELRGLKSDNPNVLLTILTVVWGSVAVYYGMPEVGFLAVASLMGLLGFSVIVTPFCYSFGFEDDKQICPATVAALLILIGYVGEHALFPHAQSVMKVFELGAYWLGSFVGFIGLLILSNKWYVRHSGGSYGWIQLVTIVIYLAGVAAGMIFNINPLAGMAGTFLVFYAAAKLIEVETDGMIGFGLKLILIGGLFTGAWLLAQHYEPLIKQYLTVTLPV